MTANKESLYWKTNKEWYRINYEKDCDYVVHLDNKKELLSKELLISVTM